MPQATYEFDHRFPIAVVRLSGELTAGNSTRLRAAITQSLVEEPTSVIIDLAGLTAADEGAGRVFAGVAARAAQWPGASVLLCSPTAAVAETLAGGTTAGIVTVYPTFADALAVAASDSVPLRLQRHLPPSVHAPRLARELATEACAEWNLPSLAGAAEILASELVTNAVRHAATALTCRLTYRGQQLRVSVHDCNRRMARLQSPAESDDHGRGLLIVNSVATRWGSEPVSEGKVVWATLTVSTQAAVSLVDADQ